MVQAAKVDAQATYNATVSGDRLAAQTAQSLIELAAPYPMTYTRLFCGAFILFFYFRNESLIGIAAIFNNNFLSGTLYPDVQTFP